MAVFIGLDIGSSFIKAAIIDPVAIELRQILRAPFPEPVRGLPPRYHEVDPNAVIATVEQLLKALVDDVPHCAGLLLCGQMHGFVLVDPQGNPRSNYVSWLDQRVLPEEFEQISAQLTARERTELGNEFRASIAVPILATMRRHKALPAADIMPVSIADFVAARLSGATPVMDATQAAAFGGLRLGTLEWHTEVIGKLDLDSLHWPVVLPSGSCAGAWRGVPCFTSVGDQQCALAGALLRNRELSINIGTGSQVAMLTGSLPVDDVQTRPYFEGQFLRTITHIPGGRALSALLGLLSELGGLPEDEAWQRVETAVAAVPSTDMQASVAYYPGPCGDAGYLKNLHEGNLTAGHVFRSVYESMAHNYRDCAERLDPAGTRQQIVFSGGVARRGQLLRSLTTAAVGLPSRLSPHEEDTLYGLMMLALGQVGQAILPAAGSPAGAL